MKVNWIRRFCGALVMMGLMTSCERQEEVVDEARLPVEGTVELLRHDEAGMAVAENIGVYRVGQNFVLAGMHLRLLEHWPHAEAVSETGDDGERESHAVEVAWGQEEGEKSWIYETTEEGPAGVLGETNLQVRVLPPGSRPIVEGAWEESPKDAAQFHRGGRYFSIPEAGGEVFPGWKVKEVRVYERALLEEDGSIVESEDGAFANRALEVRIASGDGTIERHYCFLDHPELTKGIHPALLPVARLAGEGASQSRLAACDPIELPGVATDRLLICPDVEDSSKLTALCWERESGVAVRREIDSFPAEIEVGEAKVRLLEHRSHARSVVKWRRQEGAESEGSVPALVLAWAGEHGHERAVLPLGQATPIRIGGRFETLRYRNTP